MAALEPLGAARDLGPTQARHLDSVRFIALLLDAAASFAYQNVTLEEEQKTGKFGRQQQIRRRPC